MNYRVTMTLNRVQLVDFIDKGRVSDANVSIVPIDDGKMADLEEQAVAIAAKKITPAKRAVIQRQRTSKVNATLLASLNDGPQSLKEMKAALSNAGMAPSSISTGLAQLQRKNQVERVGDGLYALKAAAE